MRQSHKIKALVEAGVQRVHVHEQLGMSKASYYRCLKAAEQRHRQSHSWLLARDWHDLGLARGCAVGGHTVSGWDPPDHSGKKPSDPFSPSEFKTRNYFLS